MLEQILSVLFPFLPVVIIILVVVLVLVLTIKIASGNEVLVVTGVGATKKVSTKVKALRNGQEATEDQVTYVPKIKVAGAAFVIPFIQQSRKFDICVKKASKDNDTMKTKTGVEIVIDWSISYAPNADSIETLQPCIRQFLDKKDDEIMEIVMSSVAGGMRAVISTMTPQQVMVGKETLDESVQTNIAGQMAELGYKVQIYIQEVRDAKDSTYYRDLAAEDREKTRQNAATITAEADQAIRQKQALTEQAAKQAELDSEVAIAERQRDAALKKASFKVETDQAEADAAIAGELRTTERNRELTEKQGAVRVMEQEQAELAAKAEQTVTVTRAETAKQQAIIEAKAQAEQRQIDAQAAASVVETEAAGRAKAAQATAGGEAEAAKAKAAGEAEAARLRADGEAAAIKLKASAEAERISTTGSAEAKAIEAKGLAEAAAIEAKGKAEAEAARALSDAQAANDRVNFEIRKLEIEAKAKVEVATNIATAMATIGEKATFYDFGGSTGVSDGGDLLTRVMGNIPQLFAKANLQNQALNGQALPGTLNELVSAIISPLGEALHGGQTDEETTDAEDKPNDGTDTPKLPETASSTDSSTALAASKKKDGSNKGMNPENPDEK